MTRKKTKKPEDPFLVEGVTLKSCEYDCEYVVPMGTIQAWFSDVTVPRWTFTLGGKQSPLVLYGHDLLGVIRRFREYTQEPGVIRAHASGYRDVNRNIVIVHEEPFVHFDEPSPSP
jgi:hypothetical protein